jgi:hypothetical protein
MGEVVNLNQYRKKLEKAKSGRRAAENRQQAGRSKRDRLGSRCEMRRRKIELDGKRLDEGTSDKPGAG